MYVHTHAYVLYTLYTSAKRVAPLLGPSVCVLTWYAPHMLCSIYKQISKAVQDAPIEVAKLAQVRTTFVYFSTELNYT
jgi:hypothetical protein